MRLSDHHVLGSELSSFLRRLSGYTLSHTALRFIFFRPSVLPSVTQIILLQIVLTTFGNSSLAEELLLIDFSAEMAGEKRGERSEQSGGAHIDPCQSEENEPTYEPTL